jgi:ribonuclease inhibitor
MRVEIDGTAVRAVSDVHGQLARALDFGPFYGNNLSALWDRLSTDVERPVELVWVNSMASREALGDELFEKVSQVLCEVQDQDAAWGLEQRFTVVFE